MASEFASVYQMSMRIAKRPTLFFRFFGVGFAHTFHKFYNLPSNTLISFNFFVTRRYDHHSRPFNTRAGPSSPMVTKASPYCRLAIRALGYGYCPTGNTPTRQGYWHTPIRPAFRGESIMRCDAHGESIQTMQNLRIQCESSTFLSIKIRRPSRVGHKNSP